MTKKNIRLSGALLLVFFSLLLASLACYSGQVPGVLELTPYHTMVPLPVVENPKYQVLETVLAPAEVGYAFFNMTLLPEPLDPSLLNSKSICLLNSPATVLYVGQGDDGNVYYLLECTGSVGWAIENRLAGPLKFSQDELALTVSANNQPLELLDERTFQPLPANPFAACQPETIVTIVGTNAAEIGDSGSKEMVYLIECPVGTKGWVTNVDLFGPIKANTKDRALAINADGSEFRLASDAAPITDENTVEGECPTGSVLETQSAKLVDNTVYLKVTCGDTEGWVDQENIIGPLRFEADTNALIYVEPLFLFEDELSAEMAGEVAAVADEGTESEPAEGEAAAQPTETAGEQPDVAVGEQRKVVQYTPPVYLTNEPGPAVRAGEETNVVGQCVSNTGAHISEYVGMNNTLYYHITCDECVETATSLDGETTCAAYETRDGWIEQQYLQGPVDFLAGDVTTFKSSSAAIETDEATSVAYARVPATISGASSMGSRTVFAGRCPADEPVTITGIILEKARTSNKFTFFYQMQCEGQLSIVTYETDTNGKINPVVSYDTSGEIVMITGVVLGRELEPLEE